MKSIKHWFESNTTRVFLSAEEKPYKPYAVLACLNERFSFQAAFRLAEDMPMQDVDASVQAPEGWTARIRRVGHVPMRHRNTGMEGCGPLDIENGGAIPGFVPDVLFEDTAIVLPPGETHAYWVTITPGADARPGDYRVQVTLTHKPCGAADAKPVSLRMTAKVTLANLTLKPRRNFDITHWFYADSIMDWYKLPGFDERFWTIVERFIRDYAAHGLNTLYVPAFTPPLDGVKRPTQLINVTKKGPEEWTLDWTAVTRWIQTAKTAGIDHFEWVHPFTQWGVKYAIRIYEGHGETESLLWSPETPACSALYRKFLTQYLGELHEFLVKNDILSCSYFHVSDEPHGDENRANYKAARTMLQELAPWMKTMDALTEIEFGRQHLTDMPAPLITTAPQFSEEGIESWCYYCCGPRGAWLNRFMDTPLPKIAMHGFLFYRWPFRGFLHWGFNYWYRSQTRELIDVFAEGDGLRWPGWAYGDTCQVYPGPEGPLDSIRFEVFSESLQDYQLLQTIGFDRTALKDITSFKDFPKDDAWRRRFRRKLLADFVK